jgi:hypothetical protein
MNSLHINFSALIAIVLLGVGLGECLLVVSYIEVRRWGRALKIGSPLMAGVWTAEQVAVGGRNPELHGWALLQLTGWLLLFVVILRLMETKLFGHLLEPTE